ncbi:EEF1A lysine methyltransferase 4 [Microdochium nivale]|nr:EEF1A lysine methyltransferase 4 [Microdochium nivale]
MPSDFEKQSYWHERFTSEQSFEWLVTSERFMQELERVLPQLAGGDKSSAPPSYRVLHLGCGTSDLHNHLRRRGFGNVTNVDYEPLAIERSRQLEEAAFGSVAMEYAVADATRPLALSSSSSSSNNNNEFDLVVDKSTADAISCAGEDALRALADSVRACLADGGVWISMSYSATRFSLDDGGGSLPFEVDVLARVLTAKQRSSDPEVYHYCYILRPRA